VRQTVAVPARSRIAMMYPTPAVRRRPLATHAYWLFLAFAAYLAVPVLDVPVFGISLSAPILLLIFIEIVTGHLRVSFTRYEKWVLLAGVFWLGCTVSLLGNQYWGSQTPISPSEGYALVRCGYLIISFAVTLALCSNPGFRSKVCVVLGVGVLVLGAFRIAEAVLFGVWGRGDAYVARQNAYGWQFSTFAPYALALPLVLTGTKRSFSIAGVAALFVAAIGNGSRGSWVALSGGLVLFLLLCSLNRRAFLRYVGGLAAVLCIAGAVFWLASGSLLEPVAERARSFERLERDKPYAIRQLMIQKGLTLFRENPLFGAGLSRFKTTNVELELPELLRYRDQESYNVRSAHNSYIAILAETGLAGSIPLAVLLLHLTVKGLRTAIRAARQGDIWPVAIYVSFVSMGIHFWGLTGHTGTAPWFVYGMTAATITWAEARRAVRIRAAPAVGFPSRAQLRPYTAKELTAQPLPDGRGPATRPKSARKPVAGVMHNNL